MKRLIVLMLLCAAPAFAQGSYIQNAVVDGANPQPQFSTQNDAAGNAILVGWGCNTIYETCPDQTPTDTEGNTFVKIDSCTAATVSDSAVKQSVYVATNIVGGTKDKVTICPGGNCTGGTFSFILEQHNANFLDKHNCSTGSSTSAGNYSGSNITLVGTNEIIWGLGTNNFGGWSGYVGPWTGTFGAASQGAEYQTTTMGGTYGATLAANGASDSTWVIETVSFSQTSLGGSVVTQVGGFLVGP